MTTPPANPNRWKTWLSPGIGVLLLVAWTFYSHLTWTLQAGHLHGLPAFFLGVLVLLVLTALARLCLGALRNGWRWLVRGPAWRLCGWAVLFVASTIVLFYNVELWRGKRLWAGVVREAQARGVPLDYKAAIPAPPPDAENFARAPLFAPFFETSRPAQFGRSATPLSPQLAEIERFAPRYPRPTMPFAPWLDGRHTRLQEFWLSLFQTNRADRSAAGAQLAQPTNETAVAEAILVELESLQPLLGELRQFSSRPRCWFPQEDMPLGVILSQQGDAMAGLMRLVRLRASIALALKRADAACDDVRFGLRLADFGRQSPQPASAAHVVHHQAIVDGLQPLWEGLAKRSWSADQIAAMQQQLEALDLLGDYPAAVRADALAMATLVERLIPASGSDRSRQIFKSPDDERTLHWLRCIYPAGWSLQDQAAIHRFHLETTSRLLDLKARRLVHLDERPRTVFGYSDPFFPVFMTPKIWEMFSDARESFLFTQTVVDLATVACALERYRVAYGEFPAMLGALVPQYVADLPHDIITSEPLKYRRTGDGGFVLYSVGFNRMDDGGKPCVRHVNWQGVSESRFDLDKNDWAWICPGAQ